MRLPGRTLELQPRIRIVFKIRRQQTARETASRRARASERAQVEHLQLIRVHVSLESEPDNGRETVSGKQQYNTNEATGSPHTEGDETVHGGRVIRATMKISSLLNAR